MFPRAPRTRRLCAWLLDFAVVLAVATLLGWLTFNRISAQLTDMTALAGTTAWEVVTSDGDLVGASQDVGESVWRSAVDAVWQAFAALVAFTFGYYFASLALMSRTPGQALTNLRVQGREGADRPRRGRWAARAAVLTMVDVGWYSLACCLLVGGDIALSVLCWIVAVAVFALNALLALVGARRSLGDRLTGTAVASAWQVGATFARIGDRVRRRGPADGDLPAEPLSPA
ncbi:RDD family protein [Streptomyces millisiae]|uniref:RDD family protein n=1 Tax=Streptomyces millisiae TaxID=3075542 RepID=A0ABU2LNM0_9ACTN|nr:RDD family protein [Streptomyces sp. DSM 44918]MDT0319187.1 RDD family protein [Streptomyces sp. DSM 44918]